MSPLNLRAIVRLVVLCAVVFALSLSQGWANALIGSTDTSRAHVDSATGQVYIFNGDVFESGQTVTTFSWFGHLFAGSRDLTPLLLEQTSPGVFTVRGIGTGQVVTDSGASQAFAFGLTTGTDTTTNGNFTFGFINALVNTSGTPTGTTGGTVDLNTPIDGGTGVSGGGTNDWVFTPSTSPTVGIGTTFFIPTGNNSGNFALNNPALGGFNVDRTYSANLNSVVSGVAEPGTFSLITGAGLVLAGLFRYRRSRKKV